MSRSDTAEEVDSLLESLYEELGYPGATELYRELRKKGVQMSQKQVTEWINRQPAQQLFTEQQKTTDKFHVFRAPYDTVLIDLIDMTNFKRQNGGYGWIFIAIDGFSRQLFAVPIKTKSPRDTVGALEKLLRVISPVIIKSDDGNEWKGAFGRLLAKQNIVHVTNRYGDHRSLSIVDRAILTVKRRLYKHIEFKSRDWREFLKRFIRTYNNRPHSGIGDVTPNEAVSTEVEAVRALNMKKREFNEEIESREQKLKIGDTVLVRKGEDAFERGFKPKYNKQALTVVKRVQKGVFELSDGKAYNQKRLKKIDARVAETAEKTATSAVEVAEKEAKSRRRFAKTGLDTPATETEVQSSRPKRNRRPVDHGPVLSHGGGFIRPQRNHFILQVDSD